MVDGENPIPTILAVLGGERRPLSISSIARQTGLNRHTVAHHLEILRVSGQIKQIQHGKAKKYYIGEWSFPGSFTTTSPDLIIILDQAGEIFYINDASASGVDRDPGTKPSAKTLGALPHPAIHHPDFFTHVREASSHKVVHVTLVVPGEQEDLHYPVTFTRVGIPHGGQGTLIIIEGATPVEGSVMPLGREIMEQLSPGFVVVDLSGEILYVNPSFLISTGHPDGTLLLGQDIEDVLHTDLHLQNLLVQKGTQIPPFQENTLTREDGSRVFYLMHWVLVRSSEGIPLYLSGIMFDITGRQDLREKIATLDNRYQNIVENTPDIIWETGADLRYTYISPAITRMTGLLPQELVGTSPSWLSEPPWGEEEKRKFREDPTSLPPSIVRQHTLRHWDGHQISIETRAIPVFSSGGEFKGLLGIDRDITERKRVEEALRENEQRLIAAQRIAKLGDISWDVETGEITWSDALYDLMQYDKSEKIDFGRVNAEIHHPDDLERVTKWLNDSISSGSEELPPNEYRIIRKDGKVLFVHTEGVIQQGEGNQVKVFVTLQDITERKQAEEALRASEEKLALVMDGVPVLLCLIDADLNYVYVNQAYADWYGQNRQDIIGKQIRDLMDAEVFSRVLPNYQKVLSGNKVSYEICTCDGVGKERFVSVRYIPYYKEERVAGFFATMLDITERKRVEEALRESKERYISLFERSLDCVYIHDLEGNFIDANSAALDLLGYRKADITNVSLASLINGDQIKKAQETIKTIFETGSHKGLVEYRLRRKNGDFVDVETKGSLILHDEKPYAISGIARDITHRKKAEEALCESEERYRKFFTTSRDCVFITSPDGRLIDFNDATLEMFGYDNRDEMSKISIPSFYEHSVDRSVFLNLIVRDGYVKEYPVQLKRRDGTVIDSLITGVPQRNPDGTIKAIIGTARDITQRKRAEEVLHESEENFRTLAENANDGILIVVTRGTHIFANRRAGEITGYSVAELLKISIVDLAAPDELENISEMFRKRLSGEDVPKQYETVIIRKDRQRIPIELSASKTFWHGQLADLVIFRDITERKRAEENLVAALKRTRDQQAALGMISFSPFLFSGDVYGLSDRLTEVSSRVLDVKRASVWLFNHEDDELRCIDLYEALYDRHSWDLVLKRHEYVNEFDALNMVNYIDVNDPLTDPRTAGYAEGYLKPNRITSMLDAVIRVSGQNLGVLCFEHVDCPHHWESDEIAFACQLADLIAITLLNRDRMRAEEALSKSEERYQTLFQSAVEGILIVDTKTLKILHANPAICRMLGHSEKEITTLSLKDIHPEEEMDNVMEEFKAVVQRNMALIRNIPLMRKDKTILYADISCFVQMIDGKMCNAGFFTDITERKREEEALRINEKRLQMTQEIGHIGCWEYDLKTSLMWGSEEGCHLFGYPRMAGSFPIENFTSCIAEPEVVLKAFNDLIQEGKEYDIDFIINPKDGSAQRTLHSVGILEKDEHGNPIKVKGINQDITELKLAEETLVSAHERLKEAHHLAHIGTWDWIKETDTVTWSEELYNIAGRDPSLPAPTYEEHSHVYSPPSWDRLSNAVTSALTTGEPYHLELELIRSDGSKRWVNAFGGVKRDGKSKVTGLHGTVQDITGRKRAEEALRESEQRLNAAQRIAKVGDITWNVETGEIAWSDALYDLMQYDKSEKIDFSRVNAEIHHPDDLERVNKWLNDCIASGSDEITPNEYRIIRKDGKILFVHTVGVIYRGKGNQVKVFLTLQDITEHKLAEEALQESRELFAKAFYSGPLMLAISDIDTGKYLNINKTFTRFTGYSRDEAIGKNSVELGCICPEDRDSMLQELKRTGRVAGKEFRLTKKDGESGWYLFFGEIIKVSGKNRLLSIAEDISERKQSEQTIQHALAEKEVLLREIHHRVKNNLAGIIALIELQSRSLTDPDQIYLFKDLETRIRSMALVHESLYQTKDIAHIRLTTYTENLTRHLFQVYETATNVQCRIDMGEITMPIETATPCGLVMTEIVTNSLKYAFPKTFSCEEIRGEPCTIAVTLHREGSDYLLGVSDNGIGIPDGTDATMSHSLGLFLIRFIVEHQLDGGIGISTARGTAYTIRFPEPAVKEGNAYEKM